MQLGQWLRQAGGRGAFHRAQAQAAAGLAGVHTLARFFGQRQQAVGVAAQRRARGREHHAFALTQEQRRAQLFFQLLHAGGHVRLHAAQPLGGAGHAALGGNGAEDFEGGKVHVYSLCEMIC
ncbi:hypothetical protein D3C87_1734760 [compost metagenome]